MRTLARTLALGIALIAIALPALAQSPPDPPPSSATRPATATPSGDTGIWFVPTAETLAPRKWSFSIYRVNLDFQPGFTDVSHWPITFGAGLGERVELFGAVTAVTRIDRDLRPLFGAGSVAAGVVNDYPFVNDGWIGNEFGDVRIGAKINVASQYRLARAAFAVRGLVKLPTASDGDGAGTGKPDFAFDAILSKEINERVELSGFGGFIVRGDPDLFDVSNGVRWGVGAAMPARRSLRVTAELHGEVYTDRDVTFTGVQPAVIGAIPIVSRQKHPVNATLGLTWLSPSGVFAGAGVNWNLGLKGRSDFGSFEDETGDGFGFQLRLGFHPGVRAHAPPRPPPPPPPAPAANRPPSVRARCGPCTVEIGRTSMVTADAADPDGDTLTYKWNAPAGTLASPADRQSQWTAPMQEGPVVVTVVVADPGGASATDAVTIQVVRPTVREFTFEDVHFDFDRYSLRPEATRALDEVVRTLRDNAGVRIEIEGHTCNIGTAEYNLALGDRRAQAVREYLVSWGIAADRLGAVSYGEERPKHDNAREETRRLNRRAALVVRVVE
jgi:outer membrane protein OmpA-like peptidoglycan-associated protein